MVAINALMVGDLSLLELQLETAGERDGQSKGLMESAAKQGM